MANIIQNIENTPTGGGGGGGGIKSVLNSTNTVPTTGSPFTGASEDILTYSLITVSPLYEASAAHTGTLYLEFSADGISFTAVDGGITVEANATTGLSRFPPRTLIVIDSYFRVRYVPDDDNITTFFIETIYSTSKNGKLTSRLNGNLNGNEDVELVKSAIVGEDNAGNFHNAIVTPSRNLGVSIIDSETGSVNIVDQNGAVKTGEAINLLGTAFGDAPVSPLQWTKSELNGGAINDISGAISIETGTSGDGHSTFQSTGVARFLAANFNICHIGVNINNVAEIDCVRTWGAYNPLGGPGTINGIWFRLDDGVMCVGYTKDGVDTVILQNNWNGISKDQFVLDTNTRVYEIQYNAGSIRFFQNANLLHSVKSFDQVYASNYNFNLGIDCENKNGNTTNNFVQSRALATYRIGRERGSTISRVFQAGVTTVKAGAGYVENVTLARSGGGSSGSSVIVYDSLSASGDEIGVIKVSKDETYTLPINSTFSNGLTIDVSATGSTDVTVGFD